MIIGIGNIRDKFDSILSLRPDMIKMKRDLEIAYQKSLNDFNYIKPYKELLRTYNMWEDNVAKINIALELHSISDEDEKLELETNISHYINELDQLIIISRFDQPYDYGPVLLEISAGVGGVDAMDWAFILSNMYQQFCKNNNYSLEIIEQSYGEEAGIKSASMIIDFAWAYGWMKYESGTHRLVRISPFNANNKRQTSFALVQVLPYINNSEFILNTNDLRIDVFRASGKGGQGVNTTDSAVRVVHIPTNTVVSIQSERSQLKNKEKALKILKSKLSIMHTNNQNQNIDTMKTNHSSASWGEQIRNYVEAPYQLVKDTRSGWQTSDIAGFYKGKYLFESWLHNTNTL